MTSNSNLNLDWLGGALGGVGSLIGAGINAGVQSKINKENMKMQKEFAQNGIQWKVQDAQKAGIHPAVALGAQTHQASPSSVAPDVGSGVAGAFKHFGSAIDSFIDDKEEERQLALESARLDNAIKAEDLKKAQNANNPNLFGGINPKAYIPNPATQIFDTAGGNKLIMLSSKIMDYVADKDLKDTAMNNMIFQEMDDHIRNLNKQAFATGSHTFYVPATLDEMALYGTPFAKPVSRSEWQKYIDDKLAKAKKEAEKQRKEKKLEARRRRIGTSADDIPFLHGYRSYGY